MPEMREEGFSKKIGTDECSIEVYHQRIQLLFGTKFFRFRDHCRISPL